jgi:Ribose/Galactose Isomerase
MSKGGAFRVILLLAGAASVRINVSLVIIVFLDSPKSWTRRLFAMLVACFALWDVADIIVDMNVICFGARVLGCALAWDLTEAFLAARFIGAERHRRRLGKVTDLEN